MMIPKDESIEPQEIKNIREKYSLSQQKLANLLGVSISLVQKWERGARIIAKYHSDTLKRLSKHGLEFFEE